MLTYGKVRAVDEDDSKFTIEDKNGIWVWRQSYFWMELDNED